MALDGAKFVCLDESDVEAPVLANDGAASPAACGAAAATATDNDNGDDDGSAVVDAGCTVVQPKGRKFTVGYYMNCDYVLDDRRAKGVHCEIQCDAFGRVTIHNLSEEHPISVNDQIINIKRPLLHGSRITILNKNFLWQFPKSTVPIGATNMECKEALSGEDDTTPQKTSGCEPEQPPSSCPDLKLHRNVAKRFTVHNFAYCIQSDDEGNTSLDSTAKGINSEKADSIGSKSQEESEKTDVSSQRTDQPTSTTTAAKSKDDPHKERRSVTPEPTITTDPSLIKLEETPKMNLIDCTQNKENKSTEKKQVLLSLCHQSDVVITSFSPRETGVRMEKSFTAILKPASKLTTVPTTPKSVYSTPKSILSESNDELSHGFMDFTTPATSKKTLDLRTAKDSSMHLIDLTTPSKLAPSSIRSKSAIKSVTKRDQLAHVSSSQKSATIDLTEDGISLLPATPVFTQKEKDSPPSSSVGSVISVDGLTDTSSVIEISEEDSTPGLGSTTLGVSVKTPPRTANPKTLTTPRRTPQSLMKRALLTSAKKQLNSSLRAVMGTTNTPGPGARATPMSSIGRNRARLLQESVANATPTTPKILISSPNAAAVLAQRRSLTVPARRSLTGDKLKLESSPASTSLSAAKLNYTGSRMISTSTPLRSRIGAGTSSSLLRAGMRKSPLHGVRKSNGSTTLSSHITKLRKSLPGSATNARTRNLVAAAITKSNRECIGQKANDKLERSIEPKSAPQVRENKDVEEAEVNSDELSRTFTVDDSMSDSESDKTKANGKDVTYSSVKNVDSDTACELNKTYSPEKVQATSTEELAEIPIDVAEVNSSTPQKPMGYSAEEVQQTETAAEAKERDLEMVSESLAEEVQQIDATTESKAGEAEMISQSLAAVVQQTQAEEEHVAERNSQSLAEEVQKTEASTEAEERDTERISESFAEIVVNVTEGNDIKLTEVAAADDKNIIDLEIDESAGHLESVTTANDDEAVVSTTAQQEDEANGLVKAIETEKEDKNVPVETVVDNPATEATLKLENKTKLIRNTEDDFVVNLGAEDTVSSTETALAVQPTSNKADFKCAIANVSESGNGGIETDADINKDVDTEEQLEIPSSPIAAEVISGESEGTAELLEEIEYVLNKSDELKQRQISKELAEEAERPANAPSTDSIEEGKISADGEIVNAIEAEKTEPTNDTENATAVIATSLSPQTESNEAENSEITEKEKESEALHKDIEAPNGLNTDLLKPAVASADINSAVDINKSDSKDEVKDRPTLIDVPIESTTTIAIETSPANEADILITTTEVFTADDEKENQNSTTSEVLSAKAINTIEPKTPNLCGVRDMLRTPKPIESSTPRFIGLRNLMRTPKSTKVGATSEVDNLEGVQSLLRTPHPSKKAEFLATLEESESASEIEAVAFTPRRSARRRASASAEITPINATTTPRRITRRRASESAEITPTYSTITPRRSTRRRASATAETCSYTPKRITTRRPSLSLDDDAAMMALTPHTRSARAKCAAMIAECGEEMGAIIEEEPKDEPEVTLDVQQDKELSTKTVDETVEERKSAPLLAKFDVIEESICEEIGAERNTLQECAKIIIAREKTEQADDSANAEITENLDVTLTEDLFTETTNVILPKVLENQLLQQDKKEQLNVTAVIPFESDDVQKSEDDSEIHDESDYEYGKEVAQNDATKIADTMNRDAVSSDGQPKTPKPCKTVKITEDSEKTPIMLGVRELLKTPKVDVATPQLVGVRELVRTPKSNRFLEGAECDKLEGLSELVKTPKTELKSEIEIKEEEPASTSAEARLAYLGMRELLQTPKYSSTPQLKGVRELMKTPKASTTPQLGGIKRLMETPLAQVPNQELIVTTATSLHETVTGDELDKIFRTPRAKNLMIPGLPASAVLEKDTNSVELATTTEYDLNASQNQCDTENLEDIFKTPVSTRQRYSVRDSPAEDTITEENEPDEEIIVPETPISSNIGDAGSSERHFLSAEKAFDELVGQVTTLEKTPPQKVYTRTQKSHIAQSSPFSATDVITDLPKTDVQEWLDNIETPIAPTTEADYQSDDKYDIEEREVTMTTSMIAQDIASATADPIADLSVEASVYKTDTSQNVTENLVNVSTASSAVDPLLVSTCKTETVREKLESATKNEDDSDERPSTPIDAEMSGINLLDQTNESDFSEPLVVSDSDSVVDNLDETQHDEQHAKAEESVIEVDKSSEKDFPIMIVDSDSEVSDSELEKATAQTVEKGEEASKEIAITTNASCLQAKAEVDAANKLELQEEFKHFQAHHILRTQRASTPNQRKARAKLSRKTLGAEEDLQVTIDLQHEKSILNKAKHSETHGKNFNTVEEEEEEPNKDKLEKATELLKMENETKLQSAALEAGKIDADEERQVPESTAVRIATADSNSSAEVVTHEVDENSEHKNKNEVSKPEYATKQTTAEESPNAYEKIKENITEEPCVSTTEIVQEEYIESVTSVEFKPEQLTNEDEQITEKCVVEQIIEAKHDRNEGVADADAAADADIAADAVADHQIEVSLVGEQSSLEVDVKSQKSERETEAKEDAVISVEETEISETISEPIETTKNSKTYKHIELETDTVEVNTDINPNVQSVVENDDTTQEAELDKQSLFIVEQTQCGTSQEEVLEDDQQGAQMPVESSVEAVKTSDGIIVAIEIQLDAKPIYSEPQQGDTNVNDAEIYPPANNSSVVEMNEIASTEQQTVIEKHELVKDAEVEDIFVSNEATQEEEIATREQCASKLSSEDAIMNEQSSAVEAQENQISSAPSPRHRKNSHSKQEAGEVNEIEICAAIEEKPSNVETRNEVTIQSNPANEAIVDETHNDIVVEEEATDQAVINESEELDNARANLQELERTASEQQENTKELDQEAKTAEVESSPKKVEIINEIVNRGEQTTAASIPVEELEKEQVPPMLKRRERKGSHPKPDDTEINQAETLAHIEEDASKDQIGIEEKPTELSKSKLRGRKGSRSKQQETPIEEVKTDDVIVITEQTVTAAGVEGPAETERRGRKDSCSKQQETTRESATEEIEIDDAIVTKAQTAATPGRSGRKGSRSKQQEAIQDDIIVTSVTPIEEPDAEVGEDNVIKEEKTAHTTHLQSIRPFELAASNDDIKAIAIVENEAITTVNVETEVAHVSKQKLRGRKGSCSKQQQDDILIEYNQPTMEPLKTPIEVAAEAQIVDATIILEKQTDDQQSVDATIEVAQTTLPKRRGRKGSRSKQQAETADIKNDIIEAPIAIGEQRVADVAIETAKNKDDDIESPQYETISSAESNETENTLSDVYAENNRTAQFLVEESGAIRDYAQVSMSTRRGRKGSRATPETETVNIKDGIRISIEDSIEEESVAEAVMETVENKEDDFESPQYEIISPTENNDVEVTVADVNAENNPPTPSFVADKKPVKECVNVETPEVSSLPARRGRKGSRSKQLEITEKAELFDVLPSGEALIEEQTEASVDSASVEEPVVISANYEVEIQEQTESESVIESEEKTDDSETKSRPTSQSSADVNTGLGSKVQFEMILEDITIEEPVLTVAADQGEDGVNKQHETRIAFEDIEAADRVRSIAELTAQAIVGLDRLETTNTIEEIKSSRRTRKGSQSSQCSTSDELVATTSRRRGGRRKAETPIEIISDETSNTEATSTASKRRRGQKRADSVLEEIEETQSAEITPPIPEDVEKLPAECTVTEQLFNIEDEESLKAEIGKNESPDAVEKPQEEEELKEEVIAKRGRRKQTVSESSQSSLAAEKSEASTRRRRGRKAVEEPKDTEEDVTKTIAVNTLVDDDNESANIMEVAAITSVLPTIAEANVNTSVENSKETVKEKNQQQLAESASLSHATRGKRTRKSAEGLKHEIDKKEESMKEEVDEAEKKPTARTRVNRRKKVETSTKEEIVVHNEAQQHDEIISSTTISEKKAEVAEADVEQTAANNVANRKRRGAAAAAVSAIIEATISKRSVRVRGKIASKKSSDIKSSEERQQSAAKPSDEQTPEVHDIEVKLKERKRRVSHHETVAPAEDASADANAHAATQPLTTSKRTRKRKQSHVESEIVLPQSSTDMPKVEAVAVTPKRETKQTRRKRIESHTDDTKDTTQSDEPPSKRILTKSETAEVEAGLDSSQQSTQLDADGSNTSNMSTPQRTRNVPRRAVAAQDHNYDESSDGEAQSDLKRRIEKASLPKISGEVKPSVAAVDVVVTTSRGRTRKPTARVQQYLEEERAKAETPKKRVLLAGINQTPASQSRPTPVRRGRQASTIDTGVPSTPQPQVPKRTRGRTLQTVQNTETSEESRSEMEHPTELEVTQSSHVGEKETVAAPSKGGKRQPRKTKAEQQSKGNEDEHLAGSDNQEIVAQNTPNKRGTKTASVVVVDTEAASQAKRRARGGRRGQVETKETTDEHQTEEEEKPTGTKAARSARGGRKNKRAQQLEAAEPDAETSIDGEAPEQQQEQPQQSQQLLAADKSADADDEEEDKPLAEVAVKTTTTKRTAATRRALNASTDSPAPKRSRRKPATDQIERSIDNDAAVTAAAAQVITSGRGRKVVRFVASDVAQPSTSTTVAAAAASAEGDAVPAPMTVAPEPAAAATAKRVTRARRK